MFDPNPKRQDAGLDPSRDTPIEFSPADESKPPPEGDVFPEWVNIVTRQEWGALPPKGDVDPLQLPVGAISFSCNTDQREKGVCLTKEDCIQVVQALQKRDMEENGLPDISYNFLVGDDGNVYEGRGWTKKPALYNEDPAKYENIIDVAYIGISEAKYTHWAMYESVRALTTMGIKAKYLTADFTEDNYKDLCDKENFDEFAEDCE